MTTPRKTPDQDSLIFSDKRPKIRSSILLFFFIATLLSVGVLSLISTELPISLPPRQEGTILSIGRDCQYFKTSLRSYSVWGEEFMAQPMTKLDPASFTSLQTEFPISPIPLSEENSTKPTTYSEQFPITLPSATRSDTVTPPQTPIATEVFLLQFPSSWGAFVQQPVATHLGAPEWKDLQSSFIVLLNHNGSPDSLILTQSCGNAEADQAAAAYIRTARWAHSRTARNAPIIVSWKEKTP